MQTLVSFSGGKDSHACAIWVKQNITKNFKLVFCDTSFESQITYDHINYVAQKLNVPLIILKSKKYSGLKDLAAKKHRFPSTRARFCSQELKVYPMIDYLLSNPDNYLIIQGIRKQESHSRSKMSKQCTFFKYYKTPYGKYPNNSPRYHSYRRKEILSFTSKFSDDILRPVFNWSGQEVVDYIISHGHDINPLYKKGFKRVGCFPCVMANHSDFKALLNYFPERIKYLTEIENELKSTFFPPDYIPKKFYSGDYLTVPAIKEYLNNKNLTIDLFQSDLPSCSSYYHLCE